MTGCHKKASGIDPNALGPAPATTAAAPTATITADPLAIDLGQSVVLNWRSQNVTSVTIDGIGEVPVNGIQTISLSNSTNFHLVAKGNGGTVEANVRVTVRVPVAPTAPGDLGSNVSTKPKHYQCSSEPAVLRAGEPVILKISDLSPGETVVWHSTGAIDQGNDYATVDTGGLRTADYFPSAEVLNGGVVQGSCSTSFRIDPHARSESWPFLNIVRVALPPATPENAGFAVNTYIIYRIKPSSSQSIQRFKNILAAVAEHPDSDALGHPGLTSSVPNAPTSNSPVQHTSKREIAPIFVPVDSPATGPLTAEWLFEHYNPALAAQLISHLDCNHSVQTNCRSRLSGDGPYLVSTIVRLTGNPHAVLIQDLSDTSPEVGGQWVAKYMDMVRTQKSWTGTTLQQISFTFAASLDRAGLQLLSGKSTVVSAFSFLSFSRPSR